MLYFSFLNCEKIVFRLNEWVLARSRALSWKGVFNGRFSVLIIRSIRTRTTLVVYQNCIWQIISLVMRKTPKTAFAWRLRNFWLKLMWQSNMEGPKEQTVNYQFNNSTVDDQNWLITCEKSPFLKWNHYVILRNLWKSISIPGLNRIFSITLSLTWNILILYSRSRYMPTHTFFFDIENWRFRCTNNLPLQQYFDYIHTIYTTYTYKCQNESHVRISDK